MTGAAGKKGARGGDEDPGSSPGKGQKIGSFGSGNSNYLKTEKINNRKSRNTSGRRGRGTSATDQVRQNREKPNPETKSLNNREM